MKVIDVKVTARDNYGNDASAIFQVKLVEQADGQTAEDGEGLSLETDGISIEFFEDELSGEKSVELNSDHTVMDGAPSLTEQVRFAGRLGFLEARAILVEDAESMNLNDNYRIRS